MGVNIEIYRQRIGCFKVKGYMKTKSSSPCFKTKKKPRINLSTLFRLFVVFALGTAITHALHSPTQSSSMKKSEPANDVPSLCKIKDDAIQSRLRCFRISSFSSPNLFAKYTYGNRRSNGIKLCQWNAGAGYLSSKQAELNNIIGGYRPHVFGVTESCFKKGQDLEDVQIQDYDLYFANTIDNPCLNVSRASVYVHRDLNCKVRNDLMNDKFSSIWLELGKPRQRKILVCIVYREWQYLNQPDKSSLNIAAQLDRWEGFLDQWESAISTGAEICVLGDVNLNFLNWCDSTISTSSNTHKLRPLISQLFDRIIPHGFVQLVSVATRISPHQEPSGLDHFYSNHPEKLSEIQAHYRGSSDHKLVFATRFTKSEVSKPRMIRKRSFKDFNVQSFVKAIQKTSWWDVYSCENVEEAVSLMSEKINSILDVMAPIKNIQVRTKYAPWMSENTKNIIKERNLAQKAAAESKTDDDWIRFKALRNTVNSRIRTEKKKWQKEKLNEFGSDSSTVWKNLKNWLGWRKGGPPTKLMENGTLQSKPKDIARIMNEFFITKVRNLRQEIPQTNEDPLILVRGLMRSRRCSFAIKPVHPDEISKIISALKSTQSCGVDNVDSRVIKLVQQELVPVITHVVNLSIKYRSFPHQWKLAKIIPLHKKNELIYPKNYRPVSLLPVFSKILERAIFCQVVQFMEDNELLHPFHHGFRQRHSTCTALLQMYDCWVEAFDSKDISAVLMLDMSAAFDLVDHQILVQKLEIYGFEKSSLDWFRSYLSLRTQQVYVDGALSDPLEVDVGVPQGSILGPLLYIIYTNDLPESVHNHFSENNSFFNTSCKKCGTICCYADDSTFSISGKDPEKLSRIISEKYQNISAYMSQNKLVLNGDKTHLLVMASSSKHRKHQNFGITLDTGSEEIEPISSEKLLGAKLSNNFTWNLHIRDDDHSMFRTLTCKINALYKISLVTSFKPVKWSHLA